MADKRALIEMTSVRKSYGSGEGETVALRDITLTINAGEFVGIMGPSGSGKSTLMHILGFLDTPSAGTYLFQKQPVEKLEQDDLARIRSTRVSFIFQSFNLLPRTTVLDNVILPLLYQPSIKPEERAPRALEAIKAVGLEDRISHLSNQLSGGQQQRVAIARALVTNPDIIFADEPTGNLDSKSGIAVMRILQKLHDEGHTIILVTHEHTTARYAERILSIRDGLIESDSNAFDRINANHVHSLK